MRWGVGTESLEPKDKSGQPAVDREAGRKMMQYCLPIDRKLSLKRHMISSPNPGHDMARTLRASRLCAD